MLKSSNCSRICCDIGWSISLFFLMMEFIILIYKFRSLLFQCFKGLIKKLYVLFLRTMNYIYIYIHDIHMYRIYLPYLLWLYIYFPHLIMFCLFKLIFHVPSVFPYCLYYILFLLMCLYLQNGFSFKFHLYFSILIFFWCLLLLFSLTAYVSSLNSKKTIVFFL